MIATFVWSIMRWQLVLYGIPRNSRLIRRTRPSRISKYREFRNLYNLGKEALNFVVFGHFLDKMVKLFEPFCKLSKQNQ